MPNCHGCKFLDEIRPAGAGYCAHVERSEQGKAWMKQNSMYGVINIPLKVRRPEMERCELYDPGCFATRFEEAPDGTHQ